MNNDYWNKKYIKTPKNFIFGYGSTLNEESRCNTNINVGDGIPARISKKFGYRRCWNFKNKTSKFTALGLEKVEENNSSTINGILYSVPDLKCFDEREDGYKRIKIPYYMIQPIGWEKIPSNKYCNIWIYIPLDEYKYNPSIDYPILQTYLDLIINGCLKYNMQFTEEFLSTTFNWCKFFLNDRIMCRRPWVYETNYKIIDNILTKYEYYKLSKNPNEYSIFCFKNQ